MRAWVVVFAAGSLAAALLLPDAAALAQARRSYPAPSGIPSGPSSTRVPPSTPGSPPRRSVGLPPSFPGLPGALAPLPDTDFVWTWGEPSADDDERAKRVREEEFVIVDVAGRQGDHACELTAELADFFDPKSERVTAMRRSLEGLKDDPNFASRIKLMMEGQTRVAVVYGATLTCVVSSSEGEARALERARRAQERRRSR